MLLQENTQNDCAHHTFLEKYSFHFLTRTPTVWFCVSQGNTKLFKWSELYTLLEHSMYSFKKQKTKQKPII